MLFSEVIGQQRVKTDILHAMDTGRLSHALLLLAPQGAGGLPLALALAQYIVCTNKQREEACGECNACKKAAQYMHPDIHFSYPVISRKPGDKPISADYGKEWRSFIGKDPYQNTYKWLRSIGAENKQGNITARECSEIIRIIGLKSYESEYKIMIIWRPEYLRKEGNRLLKLLEEPPNKTVFILVAEQRDLILNTILSRTQMIRLPALSQAEIAEALQEKEQLGEEEARRIAALADGSYDAALSLANQDTTDYMSRLRQWLNAILTRKPGALAGWITSVASAKTGKENQKQFLRYFIKQLEYALRIGHIKHADLAILSEEEQFARNILKQVDFFQIEQMIQILDDACYHIERNVNVKILFHAVSLRLRRVFKKEILL